MVQIIPAIITNSQDDLDKKLKQIKKNAKRVQVDIMDGRFVNNKSLLFDFKIPKGFFIEAHLMHKNPAKWIKKYGSKVNLIIVHYEVVKDNFDKIVRLTGNRFGLAINPETKVNEIRKFLDKIDLVNILAVNPGKYGGKLISKTLNKIKEIKKLNKNIKVEVDGAQDDKTIKESIRKGADFVVSGSFIFNNKRLKPSEAIKILRKSAIG